MTFAFLAAVAMLAVTQFAQAQTTSTSSSLLPSSLTTNASIQKAYKFQDTMMDAYASGTTVRLTQSYSDQALGPTAFTYDNAVTIDAYLVRGSSGNLERAKVLVVSPKAIM
jgi:hypothetical protein